MSLYWVLQQAEMRTQPLIAAWVFSAMAFVMAMRADSDPTGNARRSARWMFGGSAVCFLAGLLNALR